MSQYIFSSLTADEELNFSEETEVFVFPTSFAQQRLWFLDQLASGNPFYNVSTALCLKGSLNFTALKQTFNEIVRRHETLRTTFVEDIVVGSAIANRNRSELEGLIGFFVNSLVLRSDLSGNPTFRELLNRVREVTLGAYAHQDLPFEKLVEELHPERDLSRHPLFQVVFSLQNTPIEALELPGLKLSLFDFDSKIAKLDLEFHLWRDLETLKGQVVYSTDLFDQSTITRMLGHFQILLESIVANPKERISDLALLTEAERQQLLIDWNDTKLKHCAQYNRKGLIL